MRIIINLSEAIFFIAASIWSIFYLNGKLNYVGDKEKERQERVKKYGGRIYFCAVIMLVCGVLLLVITVTRL